MKRSRIFFVIWIFLLYLLYLMSNSVTLLAATILTILAGIFCFSLSKCMKNCISCQFEVQKMTDKNQEAQGTWILINHSIWPAGRVIAELSFHNLLTGEKDLRRIETMAGGKSQKEKEWKLKSPCCGAIRICVEKLSVYDMFGLFEAEQRIHSAETMIVLPEIYQTEIQLADSFTTDWESIQYSEQRKGDDPSETFGIRTYEAGDSPKMIHWKLSQKLGELYVREPGLPVENAVLLFFETAQYVEEGKPSDQAELMEKLISVSQGLTEKGITHKIGWYDQKKEELCMESVDSQDSLAQMIQGLLSLERKVKNFTGLDEYAQKYEEQPFGHILYFTAQDAGNSCEIFENRCRFEVVHPQKEADMLLI